MKSKFFTLLIALFATTANATNSLPENIKCNVKVANGTGSSIYMLSKWDEESYVRVNSTGGYLYHLRSNNQQAVLTNVILTKNKLNAARIEIFFIEYDNLNLSGVGYMTDTPDFEIRFDGICIEQQ